MRGLLAFLRDLRCWCDLIGHQWQWTGGTHPVCRQCGRIGGSS